MSHVGDKFVEYLNLNKELSKVKREQRELKKRVDTLEREIKEYMISNDMDSIVIKEGEIVLYSKKIPQTFKKESIIERLTEGLNDSKKAEELTQSILQNKTFLVEDKIRAVINKK